MTAPPKLKAAEPSGEMPFLDHLEELRWRIIKGLAALIIGVAAGYLVLRRYDVVGFLAQPIQPFLPAGQQLLFTSPIYPFLLTLKLSFVAGLLVASPVLVYQVWAFLRPALYRDERRVVVPVAMAGIVLFTLGAALAFYVVLPITLRVLLGFQSHSLAAFITAPEYFGLTTTLVLAFGAIFQLPLVLMLLVYLRIISAAFLRRHRRTFVIINAIASAVLTPGDIVVMTAIVMVPIPLFYELSIVFALMIEHRRARAAAATAAEPDASGGPRPGEGTPAPGPA